MYCTFTDFYEQLTIYSVIGTTRIERVLFPNDPTMKKRHAVYESLDQSATQTICLRHAPLRRIKRPSKTPALQLLL